LQRIEEIVRHIMKLRWSARILPGGSRASCAHRYDEKFESFPTKCWTFTVNSNLSLRAQIAIVKRIILTA